MKPKNEALKESDIFAACDALAAEGKATTQKAVREYLGGGSISTIAPAIKAWRSQRDGGKARPAIPTPPAVESRWKAVLDGIWEQAVNAADERLAGERASFSIERDELTKTADDYATAADEAEKQVSELKSALGATEQANEALRAQLEGARIELAEVRTEEGSLRALVSELRDESKRQADAAREANAAAAAAREDLARSHGQLEELKRQNDALLQSLADRGKGREG